MDENDQQDVFDCADTKRDGVQDFEEVLYFLINKNQIKSFAANHKNLFTKKETDILLNILDRDQDGIVNQSDFLHAFMNI